MARVDEKTLAITFNNSFAIIVLNSDFFISCCSFLDCIYKSFILNILSNLSAYS